MSRLLCILLFVLCATAAAEPATRSSTQPKQISLWLNELSDVDPAKRAAAEHELMSLSRTQLEELLEAIKMQRPLQPSQVAALHEIVTEIYLVSEDYVASPDKSAFLGVKLAGDDSTSGVRIASPIIGFDSYRVLRDGDRILAFRGETPVEVNSIPDLQNTVAKIKPGTRVELSIIRGGKPMNVSLCLSPHPVMPPADFSDPDKPLNDWLEPRLKDADDFWNEHFAAVVRESQT